MGTIPRVWSAKLAAALSLGGGGCPPKMSSQEGSPAPSGQFSGVRRRPEMLVLAN